MIDPVTALATASAAYNMIKKGFEVGREVEDMAGDLSRWMGAMSDLNKAHDHAKKPPLFKKLMASKTVEQEALEAWQAKIKAEKMRDGLRELISFSKGPSAWNELVQMENKIRKERQAAIYAQKERRRAWTDGILITLLISAGLGILGWFVWLLLTYNS